MTDISDEPRKQTLISSFVTGITDLKPATSTFELNRDFAVWSSLDLLPFEFVEDAGLQFFFEKNFPMIKIPSRSTVSGQALDDIYDVLFQKVKEELRHQNSLCVMFDG